MAPLPVESKMPHMCTQVIGQILDRSLGARCLCLACAVNHVRIVSAGVLSGLCRHCGFFFFAISSFGSRVRRLRASNALTAIEYSLNISFRQLFLLSIFRGCRSAKLVSERWRQCGESSLNVTPNSEGECAEHREAFEAVTGRRIFSSRSYQQGCVGITLQYSSYFALSICYFHRLAFVFLDASPKCRDLFRI